MEQHSAAVSRIACRAQEFYARKQPYSIYHGSTNCTRQSTKTPENTIDTSKLNRVLSVDVERKVVLTEPNVPMDRLVEATLPHGFIPPVVMEFPGITVGGGFSGTSGESSSFRHGFFDRTVNWVEIVLANGEIVRASGTENADLFYGAASSFGTLGITTMLEVRLIEAKPFVELTHYPVSSVDEAIGKFEEITADPKYDYLDGIMFNKNKGVVCAGSLTNDAGPHNIQRFTRPTDPWFYMHSEEYVSRKDKKPVTEIIPIVDYLFRYDRGGFWVGKYAFEYFLFPLTKFMRWALDTIAHARVMYHAVHMSGQFREYTIQDVTVPYSGASELIDFLGESFGKWPLWICPLRQTTTQGDSTQVHGLVAQPQNGVSPESDPQMVLSFGIYGPGPFGKNTYFNFNRNLEKKVQGLGGEKWLYARTYYTEEEFWSIYNREKLDDLRRKYHASHLPNLYQKVRAKPSEKVETGSFFDRALDSIWRTWPICGLYGLLHTLGNGDYLLRDPRKVKGA
ncbi:Delta(24)-sterol reductase [Arachnomyces sp. PD_36]|nr:Delta(24)-sterol reductase [Arachnomyces sp. PD_36]